MSYADKTGPFKFTTCTICGKQYIKSACSIYKVQFAGKTCHCCSNKCYNIAKKVKENTNEANYKKFYDELQDC